MGAEGAGSSGRDAAQHRSACAWLTARVEVASCDPAWCIGQAPSEQQAIRASGDAIRPAQSATLPAERATASMNADNRLLRVSTSLGWRSTAEVSNGARQEQ